MLHARDDWKCAEQVKAKYDADEDGALDYGEFFALCMDLFELSRESAEAIDMKIRNIFAAFDENADGKLDEDEWQRCYEKWVRVVALPVNILLVVDVQNDFIDGSLAIKGSGCGLSGKDVVKPINRLLENGDWDKVIYSLDSHPEDHISFHDNLHMRPLHPESKITKDNAKLFDTVLFSEPHLEQKLWPRHCVMGSWGAELHEDLIIVPNSEQIRKGQDPNKEAYSVFADNNAENSTELCDVLRRVHATDIYVCGLAYDVCVKETCLDALRLGYRLVVVDDCCAGVDSEDTARAKDLITENGGLLANSDEVLSFVNEKKRRLYLAEQAALRYLR